MCFNGKQIDGLLIKTFCALVNIGEKFINSISSPNQRRVNMKNCPLNQTRYVIFVGRGMGAGEDRDGKTLGEREKLFFLGVLEGYS